MKILFVSSGNTKDGISPIVLNQGQSLINQGIIVDFFTIKGKGLISYLKRIFILRNYLKKNKYNIIHAHYGLSGWVALLAKNKKTKLIISFMGNDILGDHAKKGKSTFYGNLLVTINQHFAKFADHIIVKSNEMSHKIIFNNKSVIPNGVNLSKFFSLDRLLALKKVGWDPKFSHILFMSDPDRPEKNFTLANTAIKQLKIEGVQLNILNQNPHKDLVYYYNASDVCLLTSYHEGSPNVIKEAMACSCPIVSTDVGDVKWVLGNTKGCFITSFEPGDVAVKIKKALEFGQKTNGRERIIELGLDANNVSKKILEIYLKVLKANN